MSTVNRKKSYSLASTDAPSASNTYKSRPPKRDDLFLIRSSGTWVGTLDFQRAESDGSFTTIDTFTANFAEAVLPVTAGDYRFIFSAYTSGTATVTLSKFA